MKFSPTNISSFAQGIVLNIVGDTEVSKNVTTMDAADTQITKAVDRMRWRRQCWLIQSVQESPGKRDHFYLRRSGKDHAGGSIWSGHGRLGSVSEIRDAEKAVNSLGRHKGEETGWCLGNSRWLYVAGPQGGLGWTTPPDRHPKLCPLPWCPIPTLGREFGGEWIHIYVWLNPFAVHLKLSQYCLLISYTSIQNKKLKKKQNTEHNTLSNKLINTSSEPIIPLLSLLSSTFLGDITILPVRWTLNLESKDLHMNLGSSSSFPWTFISSLSFSVHFGCAGSSCSMPEVHWVCQL